MSPKTKYELRTILLEVVSKATSASMIIQLIILFEIYKWTAMGPELFQEKILVTKSTGYGMLETAWIYEIWPWVKWIPLAILADVFVPKIARALRD